MNIDEPSLLSHLHECRSKVLPEGGISIVIYCGKVRTENDLAAALQVHRLFVEEEVNKEAVNITGILMGQVNSVLHLLEGPSHSILRIFNNLAGHAQYLGENPIQFGAIVYDLEDIPKRYFPEWYSCVIQEQKLPGEDLTAENSEDLVFDMATKLLDLGNKLRSEPQEELELSRYADKLPTRNLIAGLSSSTDYFTLEEFVEYYFDSYHLSLDSERSWPLERIVKY